MTAELTALVEIDLLAEQARAAAALSEAGAALARALPDSLEAALAAQAAAAARTKLDLLQAILLQGQHQA